MNEICQYLEWDSAFFQKRIARLTLGYLDVEIAAAAEAWCAAEWIDCLYFLSNGDDPVTTGLAWENGFRFVDVRLTVERPLAGRGTVAVPAGVVVRPSEAADIPALRAIARVSYRDSRFYHDLEFSRAACDGLYESWIEKSCQGYADVVWVAEWQGQAVGYLSCSLVDEATGQVGLVAVSEAARGMGLGQVLLAAGMEWVAEQGRQQMLVVTQGRNRAAQRLYGRAGFLVRSVEFWYHRWFRPGEISK
jgi:dTDP-4-amino-4,6-dideoxy-D-galactose acyltransferase